MPRSSYHLHRYKAKELARKATVAEQHPDDIKAQESFPFFCEYLTRNSPQPLKQAEHMQLWNDVLLTGQDSECLIGIGGPNTDILSPRGSAKSTYLGLFVAWTIGNHTKAKVLLRILYISYTVDIARPKSAAIKRIIESAEYRKIFPMVLPGKKWSDEYWQIDYDFAGVSTLGLEAFTVCCAGLKGGIVSKRSNLIVLDDIIKSPEDIENPAIREEMHSNWVNLIKPTMLEGARAICLGTRFRGDDIHVTTFTPARGWVQIEQSAIVLDEEGNEHSYWDFYSDDHILGLRDGPDADVVAFSFQYMNRIMRITQTSIDPKWIKKGECPVDITQFDSLALGIDLSSKLSQRNDYTVVVLGGRIGNHFYILDMRRGRWMGNLEKLDVILELAEDWNFIERLDDTAEGRRRYQSNGIPLYIYSEDVAYQASLEGDFKTYIVNELRLNDFVYRRASTNNQDKLMRLRSVTGLFQNGLVTFNMYRALGVAIEELINFGSSSHDDAADAIVYCLRGLRGLARLESA